LNNFGGKAMIKDFNYGIYSDLHTSKFHIGFPVDAAGSETKYFLVYPDKKNRLLEKGKKEYDVWRRNFEPETIKDLSKVLPVNKFLYIRRGNDLPSRCNSDSASLALVLSSCSEERNIAKPDDETAPIFLFSAKFKITPQNSADIYLESVTGKDTESAKRSLLNKWAAIEELMVEGKKVVLFLHHEDAKILENAIKSEKDIQLKKNKLSENTNYEQQIYSFWKSIDLKSKEPELFSLMDDQFECLANSLRINLEKIESAAMKRTALAVGGGILGGIAVAVAGYLIGKNDKK
jgi:hypothetical protein